MNDPLEDVLGDAPKVEPVKVEERADWFLVDLFDVKVQLGAKERELMIQGAMKYLLAGQPLDWKEWSQLSQASRDAFADARQRLSVMKEIVQ